MLVEAILAQCGADRSLLDIGGGVGVISHELIGAGFTEAVQVDASPAYLAAARAEAERRGHASRVTYHYGDFVDLSPTVEPADVVTLDRVVCCYPDMVALVTASATKARHLYGLVIPRRRAIVRFGNALYNLFSRLRGSAFRSYVHPPAEVDELVRRNGFARTYAAETPLWHVWTYART